MNYKETEPTFLEPLTEWHGIRSLSCDEEMKESILQFAAQISGTKLNNFFEFSINPELINSTLLNIIISNIFTNFEPHFFK